jgi:hypothetical protein
MQTTGRKMVDLFELKDYSTIDVYRELIQIHGYQVLKERYTSEELKAVVHGYKLGIFAGRFEGKYGERIK